VFRDERFDYRWLTVGALLPDVIDGVTGGSWVFHSVTASVLAMTLVMITTRGRRAPRRSLLAVPIGMFMHLVFDGAFNRTENFWWPFAGTSFDGSSLPSVDRMALNVVLELMGIAGVVWMWRTHGLSDARARRRFLSTGELRRPQGPPQGTGTC
ncbi:MAG: hypothetical protein RI912_672, partial [Actinomycetota bacterium]